MFMFDLVAWWYGAGWSGVLRATRYRLSSLAAMFSIRTLLKTLFAPWRRIITYPGASLEAKMRALGDNLVSRCIGFTVRFFVLLAAGVALVCLLLFALVELVVWPVAPFLGIALILKGLL